MTGILPIKKYGEHFAINIFDEYSIIDPAELSGFFGFTEKEVQGLCYWTGTETYEALKFYINMDFDGMKETIIQMLGGARCKINTRKFQNDMATFSTKDDILTLLLHLGYLTFDEDTDEVFIPNQEIIQEFLNVVDEPHWDGLMQALNHSKTLLDSTWATAQHWLSN